MIEVLTRRDAVAAMMGAAIAGSACWRRQEFPASRRSPNAAATWLWKQQSEDGGWHSQTYGLLKSGQAYTPFVLHALLNLPESCCDRPPAGVARALEFIRQNVSAEGVIGVRDQEVLEYPNYSTAYALRCLINAGREQYGPLVGKMRRYLVGQQYCEASGFSSDHPAYGGWGFGGSRSPEKPGHMDLAHTRRVLEGLRDAGGVDQAVFNRATRFLRRVQRFEQAAERVSSFDGGFYFSPIVTQANKGREAGEPVERFFRSYATATCDGLLALLAAGVPREDARVSAAIQWLAAHPKLDYPAGIPTDYPEPWGDALWFYHVAVRAEVYERLNWPGSWRDEIALLLTDRQRPDGSFVNTESALMKEDDPLLATTLAISCLSRGGRVYPAGTSPAARF